MALLPASSPVKKILPKTSLFAGLLESLVSLNTGPCSASASVETNESVSVLSAVVIVLAAVAVNAPVTLIPVAVVSNFFALSW